MALPLNKLESPSPKDAFAKFGKNWPSMFLHFFVIISPLNSHLNKLQSPLPKEGLCLVQLKFHAQWFMRIRFLNFIDVFSLFRNYLPLEKRVALHLNKLESPSSKDALRQVWLKLGLWFLRRKF